MHIDRVFLLAAPNEDVGEDDPEKKQQQLAAKKRKAIEDAEKNWLAKRLERDGDKKEGGKDGGFIKNYIDIILGNLQLCIEHVHVRFEVRPLSALFALFARHSSHAQPFRHFARPCDQRSAPRPAPALPSLPITAGWISAHFR